MSALFHPYLCGRFAAEWLITMKFKTCYMVVPDQTVAQVRDCLTGFPQRYTHHQETGCAGVWTIQLIRQAEADCVLQLIDLLFEPRRGPGKSDAPYLFVTLAQVQGDVHMTYWLQWQTWKLWLVIVAAIAFAALVGSLWKSLWLTGGVVLVILMAWLICNLRHDRLTMTVFRKLLDKNFQEDAP